MYKHTILDTPELELFLLRQNQEMR
jgi:hypothetical protein